MNKLRLTGLLLTRLLGLLLMYVSCVQVGYAQQSGGGNYPTGNGVRVREVDGSPNVPGTQTLVFPNGSLTRAGQTVTVTIASGTTVNSTNGQVPYRVNSTTFGDSAFASNALNSTYLSATSGASGAGLTLTVAGGGSSENLILTPKGANGQLTVSNTSNTAGPMFTLTNSYGSAVLTVGGGGGLSISTALTTNGGTLTVTSSGGNPVQFITAGSNIARLGNGSAAIQLLLGTSTDTADAQLSVYSQSTTRPSLKLRALAATVGTQATFENYDAGGTRTAYIQADGSYITTGNMSATNLTATYYNFASNRGYIQAPSNGVFTLLDAAGTSFGRLQIGGSSSGYPSLKRSSAELQIRLADDSGFAAEQSLYLRYGSGTPEGAVTAPVGAIYSRTDGGAGTSFYVKESGTGNTGWVAK